MIWGNFSIKDRRDNQEVEGLKGKHGLGIIHQNGLRYAGLSLVFDPILANTLHLVMDPVMLWGFAVSRIFACALLY